MSGVTDGVSFQYHLGCKGSSTWDPQCGTQETEGEGSRDSTKKQQSKDFIEITLY